MWAVSAYSPNLLRRPKPVVVSLRFKLSKECLARSRACCFLLVQWAVDSPRVAPITGLQLQPFKHNFHHMWYIFLNDVSRLCVASLGLSAARRRILFRPNQQSWWLGRNRYDNEVFWPPVLRLADNNSHW